MLFYTIILFLKTLRTRIKKDIRQIELPFRYRIQSNSVRAVETKISKHHKTTTLLILETVLVQMARNIDLLRDHHIYVTTVTDTDLAPLLETTQSNDTILRVNLFLDHDITYILELDLTRTIKRSLYHSIRNSNNTINFQNGMKWPMTYTYKLVLHLVLTY